MNDLKVPSHELTGNGIYAAVPEKFYAQGPVLETSQKLQTETTLASLYPDGIPFGMLSATLEQASPETIVEYTLKTRSIAAFTEIVSTNEEDPQAYGATTTTYEKIVATGTTIAITNNQITVDTHTVNMRDVIELDIQDLDGTRALQSIKVIGTLATPGQWPTLTKTEVDEEMNVNIQVDSMVVAANSVTTGATPLSEGGPYTKVVVVSEEPINKYRSWQVTKTIPLPDANTPDSAVVGEDTETYAFPDVLDNATMDTAGQAYPQPQLVIEEPLFYSQRNADSYPSRTKRYWKISIEEPTWPSVLTVITNNDYSPDYGKTYPKVIHNAHTVSAVRGVAPSITIPASSPDYDGYLEIVGTWQIIKAKVQASKYQLLWQFDTVEIQILGMTIPRPTVHTGIAINPTTSGGYKGITFTGTVNPNGIDTNAQLAYWPVTTPTTAPTYVDLGDQGSGTSPVQISTAVTGLAANKTYNYVMQGTSNGVTVSGDTLQYVTPGD